MIPDKTLEEIEKRAKLNFDFDPSEVKVLIAEIKRLKAAVGEAFNSFNDIIESGVVDCHECNRHEEIAQEWLKTYGAGE